MPEISAHQQAVLQTFRRKRNLELGNFVDLDRLVSRRPAGEPLSPEWKEIWKRVAGRAREIYPRAVMEKVDQAIRHLPDAVDEELKSLHIGDKDVAFFLGAGASAASKIPTVDGLLPELLQRAGRIGRRDIDALADWCAEHQITNIEDLLTAAYLANFSASNRNVTALLEYFLWSRTGVDEAVEGPFAHRDRSRSVADASSINFLQDTLQTIFGLLTSTMISAKPNPTHSCVARYVSRHTSRSSIITTNYDCCVDEALLAAGVRLRSYVAEHEASSGGKAVELLKMHGSINWASCDSCQYVVEFDVREMKRAYLQDSLSYPVLGICKNCGGLRRPLLVPPLSLKFITFPTLIDIWNGARRKIEAADYLVVVGYSFPEADTYITKIIARSMSLNKGQRLIIVNKSADVAQTIKTRFAAQIKGFEPGRVLAASGASEKLLPSFVAEWIKS